MIKPMLAAKCESLAGLTYPLIASPKLDGIRAVVQDGQLMSRNLKPIRNGYTYTKFSHPRLSGLDGELIDGEHDSTVFRRTTSSVSRAVGKPIHVKFWAFDIFMPNAPYVDRQAYLASQSWPEGVVVVPTKMIRNAQELAAYESEQLDLGYEGVMLRSINGPYKQGRSTANEGYLLKLKQFEDAEAEIIGFEERMHNGNTATTNALGHTERSSHQANLSGRGDLGAFIVRGLNGTYKDVQFKIGSGFEDSERMELWHSMDKLKGRAVKYKYFAQGSKDRPRFPIFLGFRELGT